MLPPVSEEEIDWAERTLGSGIEFDEEAREFIRSLDSLHLVACPGSGKTTALIAKLLIISRHLPLAGNRGICILTHTNVAVEQIRTRVGLLGQSLFSYPNFCGTFQSFVGKFLGYPAYVEEFGHRVVRVDNETATRELLNGNPRALRTAQAYLDRKRLTLEGLRFNQDLDVVKYGDSEPFVGTDTPTYRAVSATKMAVLRAGILFYDDVYVFAERHLARQLPGPMAKQQVVEAMLPPRHEDRHALRFMCVREPPGHLEALGGLPNCALDGDPVGVDVREVEADALEELPGLGVRVLVRIEDVGAVPVEELGEGCHDALSVGARDEQGGDGFGRGGGHLVCLGCGHARPGREPGQGPLARRVG